MKKLGISKVIKMHSEGATKKSIIEHFNLNTTAAKLLFEHEKIKELDWSRRSRPNVIFYDDTNIVDVVYRENDNPVDEVATSLENEIDSDNKGKNW